MKIIVHLYNEENIISNFRNLQNAWKNCSKKTPKIKMIVSIIHEENIFPFRRLYNARKDKNKNNKMKITVHKFREKILYFISEIYTVLQLTEIEITLMKMITYIIREEKIFHFRSLHN